jgi:acylphosphatase
LKRVKIKIFGSVQGVFFRYSAQEKARQLGLKGWAKNTEDGAVEIMAEGEKENLKKFIDWCYIGPPTAKISKIEME